MIWKLIPWQVWAAFALLVAVFGALAFAEHRGGQRARAEIERQATINAAKRIKDMENSNETFRRLPAHERCIAFMRASSLPDSACD